MGQKELIIRLIKDDLINTALIDSFEEIGFYSEDYRLNLSDTIFKLLGIDDDNDELYEWYLGKCSEMIDIYRIKDKNLMENCAENIYQMLLQH